MEILAKWSPHFTARERREFLQHRLAAFSLILLLTFSVLVGWVAALYRLYPRTAPAAADASLLVAVAGLVLLLGVHLFARRVTSLAERALCVLDSVAIVIVSVVFAVGAGVGDLPVHVYSSFIWLAITLVARVVIVPSSPRRTFILTSVACLPSPILALFVSVDLPTVPLVAGTLLFVAVITTLCTFASQLIYGLRAQVTSATRYGQYTLVEKIGEGGMGSVFKARHALLRRPAAIKVLRPDKLEDLSLERFEREVQATAQLNGPHVVAVFDYGRTAEGAFYYVMEYLDGIDLESLVRETGPLPATRVVHILGQVCDALEEAHAHGLIHRDIKPANIILCELGMRSDVVKVVDFGLVKQISNRTASGSAGIVAGTPAYLAPETITDPAGTTGQVDIYALGAVGYFLLTGKLVFEGATSVDVCGHHLFSRPIPPSQRTAAHVPVELERLVLKCLEKDPDARPRGPGSVRRALAEMSIDEAWSDRVGRRCPRRRYDPAAAPATLTVDIERAQSSVLA